MSAFVKVKPFGVDQLISDNRHHVRYGDSCWIVMTGKRKGGRPPDKENSSGHSLTLPGLCADITSTLILPNQNTTYGIMPFCIGGWTKAILVFDIDWHHGDLWKDLYVSKSRDTEKFNEWLRSKRTCLVGPHHLKFIKTYTPDHFIESYRNSYLHRDEVMRELLETQDDYDVVLFSAGLLTQVVVWELGRREDFKPKMIDTGAHWDPYAGVRSRNYHRGGEKIVLRYKPS